MPVHILFLELVIDPACSVVFEAEPEDADVMSRPPRNPTLQLFGGRLLGLGLLQGASALLIVLAIYLSALWGWLNVSDATALSFTTLVVANLGLIFANRSWTRTIWSTLRTPNAALWWVIVAAQRSSSAWPFTSRSCVTFFTSRLCISMTWCSAWPEGS